MIRKIMFLFVMMFCYQVIAVYFLHTSDYLNVVSYYTHPPMKGNIEFRRLPMLFGDAISLSILELKKDEAEEMVRSGRVGLAAVLSSYEHNQVLQPEEAKRKAFKIAELFILSGYDLNQCEDLGRSTAQVLKDWGVFDKDTERFLLEYSESNDIFSCKSERPKGSESIEIT